MTKRKIQNEIDLLMVKNENDDSDYSSDDCYDLPSNSNVGVIWLQDNQKLSEIDPEQSTTADGSQHQFDVPAEEIDEDIVTTYFRTAIQSHDRSECHSNNSHQPIDGSFNVDFDDSTATKSRKQQNYSHVDNVFVQLWKPKELILPMWMRSECVDIEVSSKIPTNEL